MLVVLVVWGGVDQLDRWSNRRSNKAVLPRRSGHAHAQGVGKPGVTAHQILTTGQTLFRARSILAGGAGLAMLPTGAVSHWVKRGPQRQFWGAARPCNN